MNKTTSSEVGIAATDGRAKPEVAAATSGFVRRSKTALFDRR